MKDVENLKKDENLMNDLEKSRLYHILTLECVKIIPWDLNVSLMKIDNIFGMDLFFSRGVKQIDYQDWLEIVHPEDKLQILPPLNMILEGKVNEITIEYRIKRNCSDYRWVKTIANVRLRDVSGKPVIIGGINQDITDSKTTRNP